MTDWIAVINQLETEKSNLKPGDARIHDIEAAILAIRSDALGENHGHAYYLANNPGAREANIQRINEMVSELIPKKGKEK